MQFYLGKNSKEEEFILENSNTDGIGNFYLWRRTKMESNARNYSRFDKIETLYPEYKNQVVTTVEDMLSNYVRVILPHFIEPELYKYSGDFKHLDEFLQRKFDIKLTEEFTEYRDSILILDKLTD